MKWIIYGICAAFFAAMAFTIYYSGTQFDGLVEEGYSKRGEEFFAVRERERELGLEVDLPEGFGVGKNRVRTALSASGSPLEGARVVFFAGRVSEEEADRRIPLEEIEPGVYGGETFLEEPGRWLFGLDIEAAGGELGTSRRWFAVVEPGDGGESLAGAADLKARAAR